MEDTIKFELEYFRELFGENDKYLKIIEKEFNVTFFNHGDCIKITGNEEDISNVKLLINYLVNIIRTEKYLNIQRVNYSISLIKEGKIDSLSKIDNEIICYTVDGKYVKPKTLGQKNYIESINKNMMTFGLGPAGTGKSYLAMAMAISAFKKGEIGRIILTRPAIEAGERLGFLPGDLQSKIDPYLRPLYDALYQIMGAQSFLANLEKGLIEVAPLAYMRGRTLDNAFIILDEAQNTTPVQMKMFLTRIGFNSKVVITGDMSQKDLPFSTVSGLEIAINIISKIDDIGIIHLTSKDVVRHPLVQKIVDAYEKYEENNKNRSNHRKK